MKIIKILCRLSILLSFAILSSCIKDNSFPMKIIFIEGTVHLKTDSSSRLAELNQIVKEGDTITTEENSIVNIIINDVSIIKVAEKTIFKISKIRKNSNDELLDTAFNLEAGRIFAIFHKIAKGSTASISTQSTVMAVRGTAFSASAYMEDEQIVTSLQVVDGKVDINSLSKPEISETVSKGENILFGSETIIREKGQIDPASAIELTDEFIEQQKNVDKINNTPRDYEELKKSVEITVPVEDEKKAKAAPVFKTEQAIRNFYKRLERIKLDDGSVFIGAIIFQDLKTVKINTVNGIISVPAKSVIESKMIYK